MRLLAESLCSLARVQEKVANGPLVVVSDYPASESASAFTRALQDAINFELILQNARGLSIDVQDDEVEAEIGNFLQTRGAVERWTARFSFESISKL